MATTSPDVFLQMEPSLFGSLLRVRCGRKMVEVQVLTRQGRRPSQVYKGLYKDDTYNASILITITTLVLCVCMFLLPPIELAKKGFLLGI